MIDFYIKFFDFDLFFYLTLFLFIILIVNYYYISKDVIIKKILVLLRSLTLFIVLAVLLNPVINYQINKDSKRNLDIYVDNTSSIKVLLNEDFNKVEECIYEIDNWKNNYDIKLNYFSFSDSVHSINGYEDLSFDEDKTSFSNLFEKINRSSKADNEVLIISDGSSNYGKESYEFTANNKIHIIGVGTKLTNYNINIEKITISENDDSSQVNLSFLFNVSGLKSDIINSIYLKNEKNINLLIGNVIFKDDNMKNIIIPIKKEYLSRMNILSLSSIKDDYITNPYFLETDYKYIRNDKLLLISGYLSPNTKSIKELLLKGLGNVDIEHYYSINNSWNRPLNEIKLDDYVGILYDNFMPENLDNYLYRDILDTRNIIFIDDSSIYHDYIHNDNCSYIDYDNEQILFTFKDKNIKLPPVTAEIINCTNNLFIDNPFFFSDSTNLIVNIRNLYLNNFLSTEYASNNSLFNYLSFLIENHIYNRSKEIDIYSLSNTYDIQESIDIYYSGSKYLNNKAFSLEISDFNNNTFSTFDNEKVGNNIFKFSLNLPKIGYYRIQGVLHSDSDKKISNQLTINTVNYSLEKNNVHLNEDALLKIANLNDGSYEHLSNCSAILSNLETGYLSNSHNINRDILSYQYLLIIVIFLLLFEWYIRNKIGLP